MNIIKLNMKYTEILILFKASTSIKRELNCVKDSSNVF